jgi:hypothetical protein
MDARSRSSLPFGWVFGFALALSWTLATAAIVLAMWADRTGPAIRLATWAALWTFVVLVPTVNAWTIHRAVARIKAAEPGFERSLDELARLRPLLLFSATMTLLSACALIFRR